MSEHDNDNTFRWYVIHTYSGYENKVKKDIENMVANRSLQSKIGIVDVPVEKVVEVKENGQRKEVERKKFPGYVLLKMIMDDETWYVIRNTRGVTSFVGPASKPVPLSEDEVESMGLEKGEIIDTNIKVGDTVQLTEGGFKDSIGTVSEVNIQKRTIKVLIQVFGRETPMELDFGQVQLLD